MADALLCAVVAGFVTAALAVRRTVPVTPAPGDAGSKVPTVFTDPNFPRGSDGRVHHLGLKAGDVAHRILSVGDAGRGARIAALLDGAGREGAVRKVTSSRGFITYTGTFNGVPVSIIVTGMGVPMMDFVVRETRPLVEGRMAILRYGTCGGLQDTPTGTVVVASKGCVMIRREPDAAGRLAAALRAGGATATAAAATAAKDVYSVSEVVLPDAALSALYEKCLTEEVAAAVGDRFHVVASMGASADSFYSSQGRVNAYFMDGNEKVIERLTTDPTLSELRGLEMESFHLLDLARSASPKYPIAAAAAAMVLANRHGTQVLANADLEVLEKAGGRAALTTLVRFEL